MEENSSETSSKDDNKPSITEYVLLLAVIVLIIFKYQEQYSERINETDKSNYMNGVYDRVEGPDLYEVPMDYRRE